MSTKQQPAPRYDCHACTWCRYDDNTRSAYCEKYQGSEFPTIGQACAMFERYPGAEPAEVIK